MKRAAVFLLFVASAGCATNNELRISPENLAPLVREQAFRDQPELNPATIFKIEEYEVENLRKNLGVQLFLVRYMSAKGEPFNETLMVYHDRKVTPFSRAAGGHGLMSAVMVGDDLYYTFSWGSGIHRSQIGRLSADGAGLTINESGGYEDVDLFVRKDGDGIRVEAGRFVSFNSWEPGRTFGWLRTKGSFLAVIDDKGNEIVSRFDGQQK